MIALTFSGPDGTSATLLIRSPWDELLPRLLTQALRYFEPVLLGYPGLEADEVVLDDFFPLESVRAPSPGLGMVSLYPIGLAMRPGGRIVVAGSSFAVEVDRMFRVAGYPGADLLEQGIFNYAGAVSTTPAGTIYFRPTQGSDVYRVLDGVDRTQRLRAGVGGFGPLTVLPDGSIVTIDTMTKRAISVSGSTRRELDLFLYPDSYLTAATAGPTGTIWALDSSEQRINIYSPEGRYVDTIVPAVPQMAAVQTVAIATYPGGEFLMLTREGLWKVERDGRPVWSLRELPRAVNTSFMQMAGLAVDPQEGLIYLLDSGNRVLIRLRETREGADAAETDAFSGDDSRREAISTEELRRINRELGHRPDDPELLLAKAVVYEDLGATLLAETTYEHVLDLDPFGGSSIAGLDRVRFIRLVQEADRLAEIARNQLRTMGPATAHASYVQALQSYEQILAVRPGDEEIRRAMEVLRREFTARDTGTESAPSPLRIDGVAVDNLFPGLFSTYRDRPVGTVTLTNRGDEAISSIRVSAEVRRYSDFPTESALGRPLPPGSTIDLPVRLILNDAVFTVEEDLPLQVGITVRGETGSRDFREETTSSFTLFRRSALVWDETERLAGFITPNEGNVSRFAFAAANATTDIAVPGFTRAFLRAQRIADALGLHGILYVEDPQTPISEILGRTDVVDTVRFPRTTLLNRAGDCDDTTTLLCSLYEAAGIPTAIVTTPDHVLMAFDTGDAVENRWLYEDAGFPVFVRDNRIWLPIETTVLSNGFVTALEAAAQRIAEAGGPEQAGFVTTEHSWTIYPTIPIPPTELNITLPPEDEIRYRYQASGNDLTERVYLTALRRMESSRSNLSGEALVRHLGRMGALHTRFGETEAAESALREAIATDPGALVPSINLATLYIGDGRPADALEVLGPVYERASRAILVNALLARASFDVGDIAEGRRFADVVESRSPEMARRYGLGGDGGATRASGEMDPTVLPLLSAEEEIR
jgi:tetratricopeptide (TPR) repeat protein